MLNWCRTANQERFLEQYDFKRWVRQVGATTMAEAIYKATEEQLDHLYWIREEIRIWP